jgi:hypothetical protein
MVRKRKQNKILKSCGAVFSIIIWTKWCWFELFNVDTLNNLFRYYDVELIMEKINVYQNHCMDI